MSWPINVQPSKSFHFRGDIREWIVIINPPRLHNSESARTFVGGAVEGGRGDIRGDMKNERT